MNYFTLRNCNYEFKKKGKNIFPSDSKHNFFIHVDSDDCDNDIFNCISDTIYDELIEFMNRNDNFSIMFTQCEGTTTDFKIVSNHTFNGIREMKKWWNSKNQNLSSYKYLIADYNEETIKRFE